MKINSNKIPEIVKNIWFKLDDESYLVGGCVRDLILNRKPKDWDITTKNSPEEIKKIFPNSFYENRFFTVGVKTNSDDPTLNIIEITTFRTEGKYSDFRHPDEVKIAKTLKKDLKRRDFTINALALDKKFNVIDYFNGIEDLKNKLIRTVGNPIERFKEDPLRMIRAIRLSCQLNFQIENKTLETIKSLSSFINLISKERIKDELIKIIISPNAVQGIELLRESNLLMEIIPELIRCYNVGQNKHHKYNVYTHLLKSLEYAVKKNYSLEIRLASLFHDIGKPLTKQGEGPECTFYNHEIVGAKMTKQILQRLKFPKKIVDKVTHLVKHHMFYLELDKINLSAVRRLVNRLGVENIEDFFKLREADRIGSGVKKAVPYRLRYLKYLIHKAQLEPITPKQLKVNGNDVMQILNIHPGPKVGWVLKALLNEVIEDSSKNNKEYLLKRIEELDKLSDEELKNLAISGEEKIKEIERKIDQELKQKYNV
ncbi:MAG: HDIG domain-containing protein [Candidatus Parcubacteria bacterium]|nr:MAG: HDIG domain-containing protein [Candidatus Parcubacteria bacterium]